MNERAFLELVDFLAEDLPSDQEFDQAERLIIQQAAHQKANILALEEALERDGLVVQGYNGQPRLNMAATELRNSRLAFAKLLKLAVPGRQTPRSSSVKWRT